MPPDISTSALPVNLRVLDFAPPAASLQAEVLAGLGHNPRQLPPKLFYDRRGSRLFRAICATDAYYLTRTENAILRDCGAEIAGSIGPQCAVIEPGAGDMHKIRLLLPALSPRCYAACDIAQAELLAAATALAVDYPALKVVAVHGDFTRDALSVATMVDGRRRILFFPGSTLGNFEPDDARAFLTQARALVGSAGGALIGVDLVKDSTVLDRAYNDPEGYTAQFNLNLLARLNRELGADFDLHGFAHHAFYNARASRIEMHLVSMRQQAVTVAGQRFRFASGDTIHTENSYKYTPEALRRLAAQAGWPQVLLWTDARQWFGVFLLSAR
jgi:dimethylhistidine N-methyltransferase